MKNLGWAGLGVVGLLAGVCMTSQADVYIPKDLNKSVTQPVQSAEDAVSRVPGLRKMAHGFFIGDGFKMKLSGTELRIDHMATQSRAPMARRTCMVSLNMSSPVAFFGSSMELPLATSPKLGNGWAMTSLGDYVLHFSKDAPVASPTLGFKLTARF